MGPQKTKVIIRLSGGGVGEVEFSGPLRAIKISEAFAGTISANIDHVNTVTLDRGGYFSVCDGQIVLTGKSNAEITPISVKQAFADLIWDIKVLARAIARSMKGRSGVQTIVLHGNQEQLANTPSARENIDLGVTDPEVKVWSTPPSPWVSVEDKLPDEGRDIFFEVDYEVMVEGRFEVSDTGIGKPMFKGDSIDHWYETPYKPVKRWMYVPE